MGKTRIYDAINTSIVIGCLSVVGGSFLRFYAKALSGKTSINGTLTLTEYNSELISFYKELGLIVTAFGFLLLLLAFHHWQRYESTKG